MTEPILCRYHLSGHCMYGDRCAFSHELDSIPPTVCKYYVSGGCAKGSSCKFQHHKPSQLLGRSTAPVSTTSAPTSAAAVAAKAPGTPTIDLTILQNSLPGLHHSAVPAVNGQPVPVTQPLIPPASVDSWEDLEVGDEFSEARTAPNQQSQLGVMLHGAVGYPAGLQGDGSDGWYTGSGGGGDECGDYDGVHYQEHYDNGHVDNFYDGQQHGYEHYQDGYQDPLHDDGGLTLVDDDVGLTMEQEWLRNKRAANMPQTSQPSVWRSNKHPWESQQQDDNDGVTDPADTPLCTQFTAFGHCSRGDECTMIHGDQCEICHKWALHPYNPEQSEQHSLQCKLRHDKLQKRLRSAQVECGICLERVLSKAAPSERRFGLLACDHAFCLGCIRSWRSTDAVVDVDTALRTCPLCRTTAHFVTPSLVWPETAEEKAEIVEAYKERLASMDCKHFDFGDGSCPFGTSCFYRHAYRDGTLEDRQLCLRRYGNSDGEVRVVQPVRLSHFLDTPHAQALLRGGRLRAR